MRIFVLLPTPVQVAELLRLICAADLEAKSRRSLEERAEKERSAQAARVRYLLDLKMADEVAVREGMMNDERLRKLNIKTAEKWANKLR